MATTQLLSHSNQAFLIHNDLVSRYSKMATARLLSHIRSMDQRNLEYLQDPFIKKY